MQKEWKKDHEGFRLRGDHMTRIDGFSDVVFGFALTLLVVSLEVPKTFQELQLVLSGIPAFAICFYFLISYWQEHYKYFRRYDLSDNRMIALNALLLFIILFYVYPMKFMFRIVGMNQAQLTADPQHPVFTNSLQLTQLMVLYGLGFMAVYVVFALMYWHAWSKRGDLELNELEKLLTRQGIWNKICIGAVGSLCVVTAWLLPPAYAGNAGWVFVLIIPVRRLLDARFRKQRNALLHSKA